MKTKIAAVLIGLIGSFAVQAGSAENFTYVDLAYIDTDYGNGFEMSGSYAFKQYEGVSVIGSYFQADSSNLDVTRLSIGGGYQLPLSVSDAEKTILFLHAELEMIDLETSICIDAVGADPFCVSRSNDENGLLIGAELRWQVQDKLEFYGDLSIRTTVDTDLPFTVGTRYGLTENWLLFGSYEISDFEILSLGSRYQF